MKTTSLFAVSALALGAAACGPKTPPVRTALDCPTRAGDLTRTSLAPDGRTCAYATSDGAEVTLQLVAVNGGVDAALAGIEKTLLANRAEPAKAEGAAPAKPAEVSASDAEKAKAEAEKAKAEAEKDSKGASVSVTISNDGKSSVVTEDHGTTRVNLPGIHIVANDDDDTAHVKVGPITVNAGGDGATIRIGPRAVRLRGEAFNPERRGMRATFIYTGSDLPDGYRYVGYEAGGPKAGPITVATVKSKTKGPDGGDLYPDVKRLVRRNGGV